MMRTNERDIKTILDRKTKTERAKKESELGCRYSALLQLPYFDAIRMTIIDPMHNLYLGTSKYISKQIWIKRNILTQSSIDEINDRISSFVIPPNANFCSLPPTIENCSAFTAEQMMIWVNFYSLFCLHGILSNEKFECWRHFVLASRLLFCHTFECIYGKESVQC